MVGRGPRGPRLTLGYILPKSLACACPPRPKTYVGESNNVSGRYKDDEKHENGIRKMF